MTRLAAWAFLGLLILTSLASPLAAAAPTTFTINIVSARDLGCTTDSWTRADLRVRILVNDLPVLVTPEASDQDEPLFAAAATASAQLPATITVEVEEGEPSGFFGLETRYTPCVIGPGGATRATFAYAGEPVLGRTLRGDGDNAAEVVLVVGTTAPELPAPTATPATNGVTLQWAADASGQATGHRVAHGSAGEIHRWAAVSGNRAAISHLCDNMEHVFRVIRDTPTWHVSSADVHVKTLNAAPWPPAVRQADRQGNVTFESRTTHDIATFEIHASATPTFAPSSATLRETLTNPGLFSPYFATGTPFRPDDAYVLLRAVDTGGLRADSPAIAIDGVEHLYGSDNLDDCTSPPTGGAAEPPPAQEAVEVPADPRAGLDLLAAFEVQGNGVQVDATPGSVVQLTVFFLNKGNDPLEVAVAPAAALHDDPDVGSATVAHGYETAVSTEGVTLAPHSKAEVVVTIRVPLDAVPGDVVTAGLAIFVRNGQTQVSAPAGFNVRVIPGAPDVAASTEASVSGADARVSKGIDVALAASAGAACVGACAWLLRRDATRFALAVTLYTRLAKSEALDHPGREALQKAIAAQPGISYSQLKRASGMKTGAIVHHLRTLERAGQVASRKEGSFRRFYPIGAAPPARAIQVAPLTTMQSQVLEALQREALTQGQLAERLGLSQQGTSYHVKGLERAGHIEAFYDGRVWRYRPVASARLQP